MSSNMVGPVSKNGPEWNEAWKSIQRLADTRQSVVEGAIIHGGPPIGLERPNTSSAAAARADSDDILFISEQAQRDFAEIASASATLRKAQPDLEVWSVAKIETAQPHKPTSVWLVVGADWISTLLLMAMATLAIASLLR